MGQAREALPARLVIGMLSAEPGLLDAVADELVPHFGAPDYVSPLHPFNFTTYYQKELGPRVHRRFLSYPAPYAPDRLVESKLLTNQIEQGQTVGGRRRINLDPGYITLGKLVLATTKDQAHRIYVGRGVYAEVTLAYHRGGFQPWPWTYPDYRAPDYLAIFDYLRGLLAQAGKA